MLIGEAKERIAKAWKAFLTCLFVLYSLIGFTVIPQSSGRAYSEPPISFIKNSLTFCVFTALGMYSMLI